MANALERVPKVEALFVPLLRALQELGGSGRVQEITDTVARILRLPDDVTDVGHLGSTTMTELGYRLAWAGTYLGKAGLLEKSGRGVWVLTPKGLAARDIDAREIAKAARAKATAAQGGGPDPRAENVPSGMPNPSDWREILLKKMMQIKPDAFERLCQRFLRESGFTQVVVTGKTGDGGIDGYGVLRLAGLISFPVLFQCKRYQKSVGAPIVRDFRGAMAGRADRGLLITTGTFTQDARAEASRDGAHPVDLVDGLQLVDRVKELGLGIQTSERIEVDESWFDKL